MTKKRVLVSGATGFVGGAVVDRLMAQTELYEVIAVGRSGQSIGTEGVQFISGLELNKPTGWSELLKGVDVVVHCAARAHIMNDQAQDPLAEFRRVNVEGSLALADQAIAAGVKRFVFLSSIKVHGENTNRRPPFKASDRPSPEDAYAISKFEAEVALKARAANGDMEMVVVRPPLVYGPGVKGNFRSLLKLCHTPVPLPFGSMGNKRSMIYVGNLADFIEQCVSAANAANQDFLVSDDETFSLPELLAQVRRLMNRSPLMVPVPLVLFHVAGRVLGKSAAVDRLLGDLAIDSESARRRMKWSPPYPAKEGLQATVDDYNRRKRSGELV
ncbi:NAD-dependent epimerase/dehydratase family protein [Marinobacter daepoensis]|uniref:NAD-dependent epimerase/dehydratase family protein n=1 Tax=Marinobacter daepoensis TaxID=262077 RepID=A0ABS3BHL1_9GAMM|nr:NAD-dependent epimerase/dehydratase family protein [Marinobacter daepoensis]MBN7771294.1 NAD-dependent epimerase/dehydratase family protein [Marinobacter daepoensis]MBY6079156.1 NAD-dependent epimerase/dehydratase family protein [Marinobacter daepoensis]